jgi:hypothetical protein
MNWKTQYTKLLIGLAVLMITAVALPGCDSTTGVSENANQAMFRGNLARTGVYPDGGPKKLTELAWKAKTGDGVFSSPAVSGGVVYFGSDDGHLYAVR